MDEVVLFVCNLIALCQVFGGFVDFFGKFAGKNTRNASLLPEVPHSVHRRERENKQKLSEPKVRSVHHGLERAKMVENWHTKRGEQVGKQVENDAGQYYQQVADRPLVWMHKQLDVDYEHNAAEYEVACFCHACHLSISAARCEAGVGQRNRQ